MSRNRLVTFATFTVLFLLAATPSVFAQVSVTAANPSSAAPGTVNLNVTISGSGFKRGAKSQFFKTGTTDSGDVVVNGTAFTSSSEVVANITVSSTAADATYDIAVVNTNGSSGKGTELFGVKDATNTSSASCTTTGTPSGFTLVGVLNPVNPATGAATITTGKLGNGISIRPVDLDANGTVDVLIAFVTSGQAYYTQATYVFLLDPATGMPLANNPVTSAPWQNPMPVLSGFSAGTVATGDVNGDQVPDFLTGNGSSNGAFLFVGSIDATTKNLAYAVYTISPPSGSPLGFGGGGKALGDLDGDGRDEIVIGANAVGSKRRDPLPSVYIYKFNGSGTGAPVKTIVTPTGTFDRFGSAVAVGNIDGNVNGYGNLVVSSPYAANGTSGSGKVFVYQGAVLAQTSYFTLIGPGTNFGWGVQIADVYHDSNFVPDLVVTNAGSQPTTAAMLYTGPVSSSSTYVSSLQPVNGLSAGWDWPGMDMGDLGSTGAILVGATDSNNNGTGCSGLDVGAAHLYVAPFSSVQMTNYLFEPPPEYLPGDYGYSVAIANGLRYVLIGEHFANVGTTQSAGQIFVYRMN